MSQNEDQNEEFIQAKPVIMAEDVIDYLSRNKDFFNDHAEIFGELLLPTEDNGNIVSMATWQVDVLRKKNKQISRQLNNLVKVARDNDLLAQKIHQITLALLDKTVLDDIFTILYDNLCDNFHTDHVAVRIFDTEPPEPFSGREFVSKDSDKVLFKNILKDAQPVCGQMDQSQKIFLFDNDAEQINSVVIMPLSGSGWSGILAIGSIDGDRFKPDMHVELLINMADVLNIILNRGLSPD